MVYLPHAVEAAKPSQSVRIGTEFKTIYHNKKMINYETT
jgi:hypothetical protein